MTVDAKVLVGTPAELFVELAEATDAIAVIAVVPAADPAPTRTCRGCGTATSDPEVLLHTRLRPREADRHGIDPIALADFLIGVAGKLRSGEAL